MNKTSTSLIKTIYSQHNNSSSSLSAYILSSRVSLEHGKKFACLISGTISKMIVILRQYPLVKFLFDCAELAKACGKQTGFCGRDYEIVRRKFNR